MLHAEADRLCRSDWWNFHGAAFIVRDREGENFQLLVLFGAGFGIGNHDLLEALQHRGMLIGVLDPFHGWDWVGGSRNLPFRILGVRADFLDESLCKCGAAGTDPRDGLWQWGRFGVCERR